MSKGLAAKGLGIDFGDLDKAKNALVATGAGLDPAVTAAPRARSGVAAVARSVSIQQKLHEATEQLKQFEDAKLIVKLDPARIRDGKWKNRDVRSFDNSDFARLKEEISHAGGNVQAVKVRRAGADEVGDLFEIVYGRRRTRACLELGLPVNVVIDNLSDVQAYLEMHRENVGRADLTPWESGVMYQDALQKGLFASIRKLSEALGAQVSNVSTAIKLAELPAEVLAAFPSPLDLQYRWAAPLHASLQADPERVMREVEMVRAEPGDSAKEVFERLTGQEGNGSNTRDLKTGRKSVGTWTRLGNGGVTMRLKPGALTKEQEKKLLAFLNTVLG